MEFTFRTEFFEVVNTLLMDTFMRGEATVFDRVIPYRVVFPDDRLMRELTQWAAAAFACGLIESPRIERM